MAYKFEIKQRLILELTCGDIFEGDYISGSKDRIDLIKVCDYSTKRSIGEGIRTFYRCEIHNIRMLAPKESDTTDSTSTCIPNNKNYIKLPPDEYHRLKDLTENAVYITNTDKRYFDAVEHLGACENIGVVGLASNLIRHSKLDLLVVASWDQVYIFDLNICSKKFMPKELWSILTTNAVRKVIHDSRFLMDCLSHSYKGRLSNIFDTQIADLNVRIKNANGKKEDLKIRSLSAALSDHFHFPHNLLEQASEMDLKKWQLRPMGDIIKIRAAQLAVYLIPLKNHLEDILLKEFLSDVELHATSTMYLSPVEAQMIYYNKEEVISKTNGENLNGDLHDVE